MAKLAAFDDLVPACARFLAVAEPAHEGRESLVARAGRIVYQPFDLDERCSGICYLDPVIEDLNEGAGSADGEVLVNKRVNDKFS